MSHRRVSIARLADHPQALESLVRIFETEWPGWYLSGRGDARSDLLARMQRSALPLALVALDEGVVAGSATIAAHAIPLDRDLTPAVIGLVVLPSRRGQGVARALLASAAEEARNLGFFTLHAMTATASGLFVRLGWQEIGCGWWEGEEARIFRAGC